MNDTRPTTLTEHDRLKQVMADAGHSTRWASDSIHLAQTALGRYDGRKLNRAPDYHAMFREVAVEKYATCRDVGGAIIVFDHLLATNPGALELMGADFDEVLGAISLTEAQARLGFRGSVDA